MTDELPEKLPLTSMDVAAEKRDELRRILATRFPEAVSEGKIDLDQLKRVLGEWVEPDRERFGLNWPGKAACMKVIQAPSVGTLKPCPDDSVDWDATENIFIEGDNLEVLKLLQKSYFGKIKMIYIDPPYNTGKEFIYPDKYAETLETYLEYTGQKDSDGRKFSTNTDSTGRFHSRWLNMMLPRLYLAKNLLREDGVIFMSIDDGEFVNLKLMADGVFGQENCLGAITVVSNLKGRSDDKFFATAHNYILAYGGAEFRTLGVPLPPEYAKDYDETDDDGVQYRTQGLRKRGSSARREDRPNMFYPFYVNPADGSVALELSESYSIEVLPRLSDGSDGRWRWGLDTARQRLNELLASPVGKEKRWDVFQKDAQSKNGEEKRIIPKTVWMEKGFSNESGTLELKKLFGERVFETPKPLALLEYCMEQATQDGDIVLDFFAGSATLAHAVFNINLRKQENRHFILVQLPEKADEESDAFKLGYRTIADIAADRIRRAGAEARSRLEASELDLGFRLFKLTSSNFKTWDGDVGANSDSDLLSRISQHADHIDTGSTSDSILFELLLKDGFPLTTKIASLVLAGKEVFSIADGALLVCLESNLSMEVLDAMADLDPSRVICLDSGFQGNDQLKANAVQTFKARARSRETAIEFRTV